MKYDPSKCKDYGTLEHDQEMLDWLDEARTNSDLYLLSGWARCRIEDLRKEVEARPAITPEMAHRFLTTYENGCTATWAALNEHAKDIK